MLKIVPSDEDIQKPEPETEEEATVRRKKAKEEQRKADNERVRREYRLRPRGPK